MLISEIANRLNKSNMEVLELCTRHNMIVYYDPNKGKYLLGDDAEELLQQETEQPTRYLKHGRECKEFIKEMLGSDGLMNFYLGNVIKYIYRNNSIGDIEKAKTYLEMYINEVKAK